MSSRLWHAAALVTLVAVVSLLTVGSGCTTTTRYRVPLQSNPMRAEALACERTCQEEADQSKYLACLETCPGVTITPGECRGAEDRGPIAICREESKLSDTGKVMIGVGIGATLLAGLVYAAAAAAADSAAESGPLFDGWCVANGCDPD